jgi:predicted O-methyltransferase YrrM
MSTRSKGLDDRLYAYLQRYSLQEHPVLTELRERTAEMEQRNMQIAPEQGQFMGLLAELIGARRCIELGTFTGYSALAVALRLPEDGSIIACDVSREWTAVAEEHWERAGVRGLIDLRIAPATETLDGLLEAGEGGTFDLAFMDADKENYPVYYEQCLALLRTGGLLIVDNVFWDGAVADPATDDASTVAIRDMTRRAHGDQRVTSCIIPVADGLLLARKR